MSLSGVLLTCQHPPGARIPPATNTKLYIDRGHTLCAARAVKQGRLGLRPDNPKGFWHLGGPCLFGPKGPDFCDIHWHVASTHVQVEPQHLLEGAQGIDILSCNNTTPHFGRRELHQLGKVWEQGSRPSPIPLPVRGPQAPHRQCKTNFTSDPFGSGQSLKILVP